MHEHALFKKDETCRVSFPQENATSVCACTRAHVRGALVILRSGAPGECDAPNDLPGSHPSASSARTSRSADRLIGLNSFQEGGQDITNQSGECTGTAWMALEARGNEDRGCQRADNMYDFLLPGCSRLLISLAQAPVMSGSREPAFQHETGAFACFTPFCPKCPSIIKSSTIDLLRSDTSL